MLGIYRFSPFNFHYLRLSDDSERERKGKYQARLGVESFSGTKGESRATQHALESAHEVVVADETKIAVFAKSDSRFVEIHRCVPRTGGN